MWERALEVLRRRRGDIAFFAAVGIILFYNFPYFRALQHANEMPRVFLTLAIVEEGRFAIDTYRHRYRYYKAMDLSRSVCYGPRADRALRRTLRLHGPRAKPRCEEHYYSNKAPGMSFLAVPFYAALRTKWKLQGKEASIAKIRDGNERFRRLRTITWVVRVGAAGLPAFLFLILLYRFLGSWGLDAHPRRLAVAAYGLGTLVLTYSVQLMSHQLATSLLFTAFIIVFWVGRAGAHPLWLIAAGFAGGMALCSDYQLIFAAVPLAIYTFWVVRPVPRVAWAVLGAAAPLALLLYYHHACFGGVDWTGYEFLVARHDQALHDKGWLGITSARWKAFSSSFFSADNGLFYFSPWLLLGLGGLALHYRTPTPGAAPGGEGWRAHLPSPELVLAATVIGFYIYFISALTFWRGGWQTGPRYVCAMLPFFVLPFALLLQRTRGRWYLWPLCAGPALFGMLAYLLIVTTFPHFPEKFKYPLFDLVGVMLNEGYVSYNLGWLLGLEGRASLIPYFIVIALLGTYLAVGPIDWSQLRRGFTRPDRLRLLAGALAGLLALGFWLTYRAAARAGHRAEARALQHARAARRPHLDYAAFLRRSRGWMRQNWEPRRAGQPRPPTPRHRPRRWRRR